MARPRIQKARELGPHFFSTLTLTLAALELLFHSTTPIPPHPIAVSNRYCMLDKD
jgi:hypothetical protein